MFFYIVLPHLLRPISVVIMIETIFLLSVFAEILVAIPNILPIHRLPVTSAHDFISLVGCRPRLYVNLLADYRDGCSGHSYDGISRNEECRVADCVEYFGDLAFSADNLVLFTDMSDGRGAYASNKILRCNTHC